MLKKISCVLMITLSGIALSGLAYAEKLTIKNETTQPSTTRTNGKLCSTVIGDNGISKPCDTNTITESQMNLACIENPKRCIADVYMNKDCSGTKIGTAIFSTKDGVQSVVVDNPDYRMEGGGFNITIKGGPGSCTKCNS